MKPSHSAYPLVLACLAITSAFAPHPAWAASAQQTSTSAPSRERDEWFKLSVNIKSFWDSKSGLDIVDSHIGARVGNRSLKEVIESFDRSPVQAKWIYNLTVKISSAPALMRGSTQAQIEDAIDEKIAEATRYADSQIALAAANGEAQLKEAETQLQAAVQAGYAKVDALIDRGVRKEIQSLDGPDGKVMQAVLADPVDGPGFHELPAEKQKEIIARVKELALEQIQAKSAELRAAGYETVKAKEAECRARIRLATAEGQKMLKQGRAYAYAQIAEAKAAAYKRVHDRLDRVVLETTLQEVAIGVGRMTNDGKGIVYVRVGKFKPEAAGKADENGRTWIEGLRPVRDLPTALTGTTATGAINVGFATYYDTSSGRRTKIRSDVFVFHERAPWDSATNYLTHVVQMSEEDFASHKRLWELDTAMMRVLIETNGFSAYLTGAAGETHRWGGAGFDWQFLRGSHFIVNAYAGDRDAAKKSVSAHLAREVNENLTVYVGATATEGRHAPAVVEEGEFDSREAVAGVSARVPVPFFRNWGKMKLGVEGYAGEIDPIGGADAQDRKSELGVRIGSESLIGPMTRAERVSALKAEIASLEKKKADLLAQVSRLNFKIAALEASPMRSGVQRELEKLRRQKEVKLTEVIRKDRQIGVRHLLVVQLR